MPAETRRETYPSGRRADPKSDLLEWIGTAYGRRGGSEPSTVSPATPPRASGGISSKAAQSTEESARSYVSRDWRLVGPIVAIPIALSAFAIIQMPAIPDSSLTKLFAPATTDEISLAGAATARAMTADTASKGALARTGDLRREAEEKVALLERQISELRQANENSERARLAERIARQSAETETATAQEKLAHQSRSTSPDIVSASPSIVNSNYTADPREQDADRQNSQTRKVSGSDSKAANAELAAGQKLFAAGQVVEAREHFMLAAKLGLPEAALAVGNTFDPASLAKFNLKKLSDITRARQWYHRAYMTALRQK